MINPKKFTPREVLRQNVDALLKSKMGPTTQSALGKSPGTGGQPTIGRIVRKGGENTKLETIAAIAAAYDLEVWQLLVPGMEPKNPPLLAPATKAQRELCDRLRALYEEVDKGGSSST